ncbi:hypothetical protein [Streptomyces sp. NPDC058252]|uniref:hypothetical protein n=1 Tax=Streptomyces sp. NPDC058252 TaxID=3346405 RepID=UPI0036EC5829
MTRTTAGRRALQVALLVGALFALGFLCGEQAHAAEEAKPPVPTHVVRAVSGSGAGSSSGSGSSSVERAVGRSSAPGTPAPESDSVPSSTAKPASGTATHASGTGAHVSGTVRHASGTGALVSGTVRHASGTGALVSGTVRHASETGALVPGTVRHASGTIALVPGAVTHVSDAGRRVVQPQPVGDRVVRPAAGKGVRPIGDLVKMVTDGLSGAPRQGLSSLPGLPDVPGLPGLPGLPTLPGVGARTPPVAALPHPASGVAEPLSIAIERDAGRLSDPHATTAYGPSLLGADTGGGGASRARDGAGAGRSSVPQAPPGDPVGAPADQSAVDNGTPRHGDPYAVTSHHRAPLRLVPGASAVVTADETPDRFRDIPVFPG